MIMAFDIILNLSLLFNFQILAQSTLFGSLCFKEGWISQCDEFVSLYEIQNESFLFMSICGGNKQRIRAALQIPLHIWNAKSLNRRPMEWKSICIQQRDRVAFI